MYGSLALTQKSVVDYAAVAGNAAIEELEELAKPLRGLRVLNLSFTGFGTRVGDLLTSAVPLLSDLGIACNWQVSRPTEEFCKIAQVMYGALAGGAPAWDSQMRDLWERYEAMNADLLTHDFDVIVVHDPQLAAIRSFAHSAGYNTAKWILDCHLDLSQANVDVWLTLRSHVDRYDQVIFESPVFARSDLRAPVRVIAPAIDPLTPKNMELSDETIQMICDRYAIDRNRPIVVQAAPFDEAHNPLAAIKAFEIIQRDVPSAQLLLIATLLPQDNTARSYFDQVAEQATRVSNVSVLSELNHVGHVEINACEIASTAAMQASLHRGYGIHLADYLWKERPAVGPSSGGIPEIIIDGRTGFLANSAEETADRVTTLLRDRDLSVALGHAGKEYVRGQFLITRYLRDYLRMFQELTSGA